MNTPLPKGCRGGIVAPEDASLPRHRLSATRLIVLITAGLAALLAFTWLLILPAISRHRPRDLAPLTAFGSLELAEGWRQPEAGLVWAEGQEARFLFSLPVEANYLRLRLRAGSPGQWLIPIFNGHNLPIIGLTEEWQDYTIHLWPSARRTGSNEMRLRFTQQIPDGQGTAELGGAEFLP
jgi:hypothetical protein